MLDDGKGLGCAWVLAAINLAIMGLVAISFSQGPYSSFEQELWYRWRSLGFVVIGAMAPTVALWLGRKSAKVVVVSMIWLASAFVLFIGYLMMSGGGV